MNFDLSAANLVLLIMGGVALGFFRWNDSKKLKNGNGNINSIFRNSQDIEKLFNSTSQLKEDCFERHNAIAENSGAVNAELQNLNNNISSLKTDMNARFDRIESRLP